MKIAAVMLLVAVAACVGYFVGVTKSARQEAAHPVLQIDEPALATDSVSVRSDELATAGASDSATRSPPNQDPRTAAREEVEAMRRGDVSVVARSIVFTAEARALMETVIPSAPLEFARQYPTPELLAAFIFCGAQRIEGFRIETTTDEGPDQVNQQIAYKFASEPDWRTEVIAFTRTPQGWRRVVDIGLARRIAGIVGIRKP